MDEIRKLSALELGEKIRAGEIGVAEAAESYLTAAEEKDDKINAYITLLRERALSRADEVQKALKDGKYKDNKLAGVPIAVKDNICTEGVLTSAASNILSSFVPPYSATAARKCEESTTVCFLPVRSSTTDSINPGTSGLERDPPYMTQLS